MFEIKKYSNSDEKIWNAFIESSKNGTFLFSREYMNYHSDRFIDHSLLIYRKGRLYTVLPANRVSDTLYSHQGLTYGGFIMSKSVTAHDMLQVVSLVNAYLKDMGFKQVVYKAIPFIYHQIPAQEDLYALFRTSKLSLIGRNLSSTINLKDKIRFSESRKSGIRKALANDLSIVQSNNYALLWEILEENLKLKYGTKPVHSLDEMKLLHSRFSQNIKLYLVYKENQVFGGTVLYINKRIVHTQYISANVVGKESGALDFLFDFLINQEYKDYDYFDFGQSTEDFGNVLNEALIFQKEGFGGRGAVYDIYKYEL